MLAPKCRAPCYQSRIFHIKPLVFTPQPGLVPVARRHRSGKTGISCPHVGWWPQLACLGFAAQVSARMQKLRVKRTAMSVSGADMAEMPVNHTVDLTLPELIHLLHSRGGLDMATKFFTSHHYLVTHQQHSGFYTLVVKYQLGNCLWKPRWSREARGRAFAVLDSGDVVVLKETLVRGSEFLTAEHLLKGIEDTQDLKRGDISILDDWQQRSMEQFRAYSSPIDNGYITGKVDGAQGNVTFYPTGTLAYKIMCQVAKGSMTLETELGLYVFSTAGSIEVGDNMKDYVLTAVATSVNHELNKSLSPMRNWSDSSFQTAVRTQLDHVMGAAGDFSRQKTLTFELLCAKRTTYLGKVHSELAVSYEQGGAFLLGICDHQCFIPHYELPLSDFPQPIWRKVSAAGEVFEIMHDMTDVVLGQMTEGALGDKWFPGQRMNFHPEGWVFLDHKHCDAKFGPTYGKIKHPDYYRIHQFQKYGEARVLAYPEAVDKYYPTVARLRRFRQNTPLALREFLENMKTVLLEEVNLKSETYKGLKAKAQERVKSYLDKPSPKELETICRMLVHAPGLKNKIMRAASIFELNDEDAIRFGKSILMKCEPWKNDPAVMAQKEVDGHSPLIEKLLQMVVFR